MVTGYKVFNADWKCTPNKDISFQYGKRYKHAGEVIPCQSGFHFCKKLVDRNSGNYNSGHRNSGHYNSGYRNSGRFNKGNYNSGDFNKDDGEYRLFGKSTNITRGEFEKTFGYLFKNLVKTEYNDEKLIEYTDKEMWSNWFKTKTESEIIHLKTIPNFNSEDFFEITGVRL
jgi:hypothetical protein